MMLIENCAIITLFLVMVLSYSSTERHSQTLSMQHIFEHENPCFKIFKKLVMLIDHKIDVRIWENEGALDRNGEKVTPRTYSSKLFELQNFTFKLLSPKPYNTYGIRELLEREFDCIFSFQFSWPSLDPFQSSKSFMFEIIPSNPNFTSLLHWKNFLMESLITFCFFSSHAFDPLWTFNFLAFQILPPNPNFTSLLHCKNFLIKSLIMLCIFNSPTFHFLRSSNSLVFRILPLNHNFISLLHWKKFLMENLIALYFISKKKLRFTL